jgi:hypothetical protein
MVDELAGEDVDLVTDGAGVARLAEPFEGEQRERDQVGRVDALGRGG